MKTLLTIIILSSSIGFAHADSNTVKPTGVRVQINEGSSTPDPKPEVTPKVAKPKQTVRRDNTTQRQNVFPQAVRDIQELRRMEAAAERARFTEIRQNSQSRLTHQNAEARYMQEKIREQRLDQHPNFRYSR